MFLVDIHPGCYSGLLSIALSGLPADEAKIRRMPDVPVGFEFGEGRWRIVGNGRG
jgi:hypothetical protein